MYHSSVIAQEQSLLESRLKRSLVRYDRKYSWEVENFLAGLWDPTAGLSRALSKEEREFVENERLLSTVDFHYWSRYVWLLPDASVSTGQLVRFDPWESQRIVLDEIARLEWVAYQQAQKGEPQDGVLLAVPKARQEGISLLAAAVKMHRLCTTPFTLGITASENEEKRLNLYNRDIRIWQHLPWYMRPERTEPDLQAVRLTFGKLDSSLTYQDYSQKSSMAAGEQYLVGHMSELAQGDSGYVGGLMKMDYFPAIPQSWRSCHLLESTPTGRGNWWHQFVMGSVQGRERWKVKFIPWYATPGKYRRRPPDDWRPLRISEQHAEKVEQTSADYVGKVVRLSREQLYWWESTRAEHMADHRLPVFLTNYPATLEESFQFAGISVFPPEVIEYYRTQSRPPGGVYEIIGGR